MQRFFTTEFPVEKFEKYDINLKDLAQKKCEFSFLFDDEFFTEIQSAEVLGGAVETRVTVEKNASGFEVSFSGNGAVKVLCDRCLDEANLATSFEQKLLVKFGDEFCDDGDEIVIVPENSGVLNIAWLVYEFIILSLPTQKVHANGDCNEEMIQKLEENSPENEKKEIDERWEKLKKLLK